MSIEINYFFHALYVAFAYGSVAFGALAYRQISDNLTIKEVRLGEERYLLYDPRPFLLIGLFICFGVFFLTAIFRHSEIDKVDSTNSTPGLLFFVLPMMFAINSLQVYLRLRWQRTSIRTNGVLLRQILTEKYWIIPFESIFLVRIKQEAWWYTATLTLRNDDVHKLYISRWGIGQLLTTLDGSTDAAIEYDGRITLPV